MKPLAAVRPPCLTKVAQPCSAFHRTKGEKIARASASAAQAAGETSQRRSDGVVRQARPAPATKKAAVNFDSSMQPTATPIAISHRALPVRRNSTSAMSPSVQKRTSGASGVTNKAPAMTSGAAIHIRTASAAVSVEPNSRQAIHPIRAGSAPAKASDSARTPSSESPKAVVEARMKRATIGGWSR